MANSSHAVNATRLREDEGSSKQREVVSKVNVDGLSRQALTSLSEKSGQSDTIAGSNEYERKAYIIGICGGSASGKTTVARNIIQDLHIMGPPKACVLISMDSFYRDFNEQERELAFRHEFNFDMPGAFDFALLKELLRKMKAKQPVEIPQYSFVKHAREKGVVTHVEPAEIVLFEGILAFHDPEVAALCDLKIFVDIDPDIRLARRLQRDIVERGRDLAGALKQYERSVKPSFDQFIAPTKSMADIIVPRGGENHIAIDIIIGHLYTRLQETPFALIKPTDDTSVVASTSATASLQPLLRTVSASPVLLSSPSARLKTTSNNAADMQSINVASPDTAESTKSHDLKRAVSDHVIHNEHLAHGVEHNDRKSNENVFHPDQIKANELSNGRRAVTATGGFGNGYSNGFNHHHNHYTNHQCAMDRSSARSPTSNMLIKRTKYAGSPQHASDPAVQNYHRRTVSPSGHRSNGSLKTDGAVPSGTTASASFVHEMVAVDSV